MLEADPGSPLNLKMKVRERSRDGVNRQARRAISAEDFQSLSELVEGVGGNADDLSADIAKSWIAASLSAIEMASSSEDSGTTDGGQTGAATDDTPGNESSDPSTPLEDGPANAGG